MSRIAYNNIMLDPRATTVVYTDVGASFGANQPMTNLSKMQLKTFAQFTGATAELDADAGASYSVGVLAHSRYCLIEEFNGPRVRSGLIWTASAVAREQR